MTPQVEAKTTLFYVRLATWFVRLVTFGSLFAGIVSLMLVYQHVTSYCLLIFGSTGLTQPLLMPCVYSMRPSPNGRNKLICLKYILYVWLFIMSLVISSCLLLSMGFMLPNVSHYCPIPEPSIILGIVFFVPCLVLTVINQYTFCILHRNGLCFMNSLNNDIEQANVSIQISYGSTGMTSGGAPDETTKTLPSSHSIQASNLDAGSDFYVGNDRENLV